MGKSIVFKKAASRAESSILPQVDYAPGFSGRVLLDKGDTLLGSAIPLVFGVAFTGFPLIALSLGGEGTALIPKLILSLFCAAGVFIMTIGVRGLWVAFRFGPGRLTPSSWPLRLGEDFTIEYERPAKDKSVIDMMSARLYLKETAIYQRGTDTCTDTEIVASEELGTVGAGQDGTGTYHGIWSLRIPPEGPSSFESRNSKVHWMVDVRIFSEGREIDSSTFTLVVLPERVGRRGS